MGTKPTPTKAQKFKELAEKRVTKALNSLDSIRNLANPANYESKPAEQKKIVAALREKVDAIEASFKDPTTKVAGGFKL